MVVTDKLQPGRKNVTRQLSAGPREGPLRNQVLLSGAG